MSINASDFALSSLCAGGFSGGNNFMNAVKDCIGTEMRTVKSTQLGALLGLNAEHANQAVAGAASVAARGTGIGIA